jgi:S1/P1 Nuclease
MLSRIMANMRCLTAWSALLWILVSAPPLHAWGPEGHAIVAEIAWDHLTAPARQNLHKLLGNADLASIASWPDEIRPALPETSSWHYVNIPSNTDGYLASRDCPGGNCVVAKIAFYGQVLANPRFSTEGHLLALKFLVHFVGDVHQPFHALADSRGGNDIPVISHGMTQCGNNPCELHSVWDIDLVAESGMDARQYSNLLEQMIRRDHLGPGSPDPSVWADESWKIAKNALVRRGTKIDEAYYQRQRPVVEHRLALAGLRLARILNEDLDPALALPAPISGSANQSKSIAAAPGSKSN